MYTCPMHPEIESKTSGSCSKCGMPLVPKSGIKNDHDKSSGKLSSYTPLFIIIGLILSVTLVVSLSDFYSGSYSLPTSMSYFMAGFFLVFSGFKLLDLKGFAEGYSTYDILARKVRVYGYVYPFIELSLGIAYLLSFQPIMINAITIVVMTFSGLGVLQSVLQKRKFQCACLGTVIKVPLTTVTLIEDFGMAIMAIFMLLVSSIY